MDALAFLPPDDVKEGMDYLKGRIPEGAELLFQYFDQTYVNGTSRLEAHTNPQGNPVIRTVRKEPMFPADLWNCNGATIDGGPRTNNVAEGFNNRVQTLVGKKHPNLWEAIRAFKDDVSSEGPMIQRTNVGSPPKVRTNQNRKRCEKRLHRLCVKYNDGRTSIEEFLPAIAHNLRSYLPMEAYYESDDDEEDGDV